MNACVQKCLILVVRVANRIVNAFYVFAFAFTRFTSQDSRDLANPMHVHHQHCVPRRYADLYGKYCVSM